MNKLVENVIHLKSFSMLETFGDDDIQFSVSNVKIGSFDLFIGDNAQGKTRLFRIFKFMKELMLGGGNRRLSTNFTGEFKFEISDEKRNIHNLNYRVKITPSNEGNIYSEEIKKDNLLILSTGENKKILYDEEKNSTIDNFFVPSYTPALMAISDPKFKTIKLIREFFIRILILDTNIDPTNISVDPTAMILNSKGDNLSNVLSNWSKKYSNSFDELFNDFKECFSMVEGIKFQQLATIPGGIEMLIQEKEIKRQIPQGNWSAGFNRALGILCLPKSQFEFNGEIWGPSLICIDEIDNSLDFKTLKFIVNYLKDYSTQTQIILSSHSPIMSEFIHPKNWHIVRRKGSQTQISSPAEMEPNLDEQLDFFRQKYWDFYTKHVNGSKSYDPKSK